MKKMEYVEKLREQADLTIEEAKDILERNNWDLLNALVELEQNGKLKSSEKHETEKAEEAKTTASQAEPQKATERKNRRRGMKSLCDTLKNLLRISIDNKFVISQGGEELIKVPVLVPALCFAGAFWITVFVLLAGFLFHFKYSFEGKELGNAVINNTVEKACDAANSFVSNLSANDKAEPEHTSDTTEETVKENPETDSDSQI